MAAGKLSKAPDKRSARQRYWMRGQLRKNKVKRLVRHCRMGLAEAEKFWAQARGGRRMKSSK